MKYVLAGLAVIAAIAALFFRPPQGGDGAAPGSVGLPRSADGAGPTAARALPEAARRAAGGRILVYVAGEVVTPGVYALTPGARAQAALARAGGPKSDADLIAVNLAAPVDDGAEIAVPKLGAAPLCGRRSAGPRRRHGSREAKRDSSARGAQRQRRNANSDGEPSRAVDLNTADEAELQTLPGIGPALAARIVAYRETNGAFASVDELADVAGITPRIQADVAGYAAVR